MVSFSIDRGGTFTDVYAVYNGSVFIEKLLSVDPKSYHDAPLEGVRRVLEKITQKTIRYGEIDPSFITQIRMGTTVATNALLERKGAPAALVITKGFQDILAIGYQDRPKLFDLHIEKPVQLYQAVIEIDERVILEDGNLIVEKTPEYAEVFDKLSQMYHQGITSIAVAFVHAYRYSEHEKMIEKIAQKIGFTNISLSHQVISAMKLVDRGDTTVVDAYLTPHIQAYIKSFQKGFKTPLSKEQLLFMQSDGGLVEADYFKGANALLSGPAGGITGYAQGFDTDKPLIGFDMGGTSTDVSRFDQNYTIKYENEIDHIRIKAPQLEILTVAAGGGSRLFYKNGMFAVGPESASCEPGPVCYKKGGYLSITDANLVLGRVQRDYFPAIFGKGQDEPLGLEEAQRAFETLVAEINQTSDSALSVEEAALGFLKVANENMVKPIREISVSRGFDLKEHALAAFGGAGGQHACAIAKILGIKEILIHRYGGILSACGLDSAKRSMRKLHSLHVGLNILDKNILVAQIEKLKSEILQCMTFSENTTIEVASWLTIHYLNVENKIMINTASPNYQESFEQEHLREFGFLLKALDLQAAELIVEVSLTNPVINQTKTVVSAHTTKVPEEKTDVYFEEGWMETPIYVLEKLTVGFEAAGPAIIMNETTTILVEPKCKAVIDAFYNIKIFVDTVENLATDTQKDPVMLAVFNNLFMSIAEQMGGILQKTAVSTNIKERLDFSCAVFDKAGALIANAPHIPVHLGSMGYAVKYILKMFENSIYEGDVFITNDPHNGGSHLPDITVITPYIENSEVQFVVANRGHHADIGGSTPGSMPSMSTSLGEEGALIKAMKIVKHGQFQESAIKAIFEKAGARKIEENISDIRAQISANAKGSLLMQEMYRKYSKQVTDIYMCYLLEVSENAVSKMLDHLIGKRVGFAEDYLDDGTKIALKIQKIENRYCFDFTQSDRQSFTNQNAPFSITYSAVMYVLRCLIQENLPLNEGFLAPLEIKLAEHSILDPASTAAVVGGNVTTSQRIVDVLFQALGDNAASCGCMNNFSFGDETFGYYETIAGGSGAGKGYSGCDAVHTHMTNTRITDVEVIENRYPVIVRKFSIRKNSGGAGSYHGGNGIEREIEFQKPLNATLITERRVFSPWGSNGGEDGAKGENILRRDKISFRLPSKCVFDVKKGDKITILTPGGGGYGHQ